MYYELPEMDKSVMCSQCLRSATHFEVHISTHGQLWALCEAHVTKTEKADG